MALTRDFKNTILARAQSDSQFRRELFIEAINLFLADDIDTAKAMLRDYINATSSFDFLAEALDKKSKSLQRMLGPSGNPTSESLFAIIYELQKHEGIELKVYTK